MRGVIGGPIGGTKKAAPLPREEHVMFEPRSSLGTGILALAVTLFLSGPLAGRTGFAAGEDQDEKEEKVPAVDPYTKGEAEAMAAAGFVKYGPFAVTSTYQSEDVKALTGDKWMLWVETPHFKIGSTLAKRPLSRADREAAKRLDEELSRLRKKLPRTPKKVKEMDAWLTLHLQAQRLEELYAELSGRFNVTETTFPKPGDEAAIKATGYGPYLGFRDKFIIVMFEEKASLARYSGRYLGINRDTPVRYRVKDADTMVFATSREAFSSWEDEDTAFLAHLTANMVHLLVDAYRRFKYNLPLWWCEGLTHWHTRRVDPTFFNPTTAPGQEYDRRQDSEWEKKVYARVKQDYFRPARELLEIMDPAQMDFADHLMAWSRVDYLLTLGNEKIAKYMDIMNRLPWSQDTTPERVLELQKQALKEAWGFDPDTLDESWTKWVLQTYKGAARKR
ncbi:MAG: hypothetical protein AB1486_10420 [Planctomycetota bacterium]